MEILSAVYIKLQLLDRLVTSIFFGMLQLDLLYGSVTISPFYCKSYGIDFVTLILEHVQLPILY